MAGTEPKVTPDLAQSLGLTLDEYHRIVQRLGREPSYTELGLFSSLWSEHCAYKHSRVFLGRLPTRAPHLLQGPGENAGAVDIGDGYAAGVIWLSACISGLEITRRWRPPARN